ncbi:MAG: hypothetical protein H6621_08765 [Halobacteriovoraceae bacterium]|nr:hypothetical protein [Halobacteriovoraceae bacterium]MCB9095145.1 hypothetical protein [Halobacteriovoraceae bacterium]
MINIASKIENTPLTDAILNKKEQSVGSHKDCDIIVASVQSDEIAKITTDHQTGKIFIEPTSFFEEVYLNDKRLTFNSREEYKIGDIVSFGENKEKYRFFRSNEQKDFFQSGSEELKAISKLKGIDAPPPYNRVKHVNVTTKTDIHLAKKVAVRNLEKIKLELTKREQLKKNLEKSIQDLKDEKSQVDTLRDKSTEELYTTNSELELKKEKLKGINQKIDDKKKELDKVSELHLRQQMRLHEVEQSLEPKNLELEDLTQRINKKIKDTGSIEEMIKDLTSQRDRLELEIKEQHGRVQLLEHKSHQLNLEYEQQFKEFQVESEKRQEEMLIKLEQAEEEVDKKLAKAEFLKGEVDNLEKENKELLEKSSRSQEQQYKIQEDIKKNTIKRDALISRIDELSEELDKLEESRFEINDEIAKFENQLKFLKKDYELKKNKIEGDLEIYRKNVEMEIESEKRRVLSEVASEAQNRRNEINEQFRHYETELERKKEKIAINYQNRQREIREREEKIYQTAKEESEKIIDRAEKYCKEKEEKADQLYKRALLRDEHTEKKYNERLLQAENLYKEKKEEADRVLKSASEDYDRFIQAAEKKSAIIVKLCKDKMSREREEQNQILINKRIQSFKTLQDQKEEMRKNFSKELDSELKEYKKNRRKEFKKIAELKNKLHSQIIANQHASKIELRQLKKDELKRIQSLRESTFTENQKLKESCQHEIERLKQQKLKEMEELKSNAIEGINRDRIEKERLLDIELKKRKKEFSRNEKERIRNVKNAVFNFLLYKFNKSFEKLDEKERSALRDEILDLVQRSLEGQNVELIQRSGIQADINSKKNLIKTVKINFIKFGIPALFIFILTFDMANIRTALTSGISSFFVSIKKDSDEANKKKIQDWQDSNSFIPQTTSNFKESYVENILYTTDFLKIYESDKFQNDWIIQLHDFCVKDLELSEETAVEFVSSEGTLLTELQQMRSEINPKSLDLSLNKIREKEKLFIETFKKKFETEEQWQKFLNFRKEFYQKWFN